MANRNTVVESGQRENTQQVPAACRQTKSPYRHDDITYQSIAKAFDLPLVLHQEAFDRMKRLHKRHPSQPDFNWEDESPAKTARLRMVELPIDESRDLAEQALFVYDDLWVPVSVVNGNVHILPGIPRLCEPARKTRNCLIRLSW